MELPSELIPLYVLSGFGVGTLIGMTGIGGGALMTPVLILLFGIPPLTAVGTDLLFASATKTAGTCMHGFGHTIEWRVVGRLALGSIPATIATIIVLSLLGVEGTTAQVLVNNALAGVLLFTALVLIFRRRLFAFYLSHVGQLSEARTRMLTIVTGALLGCLVSITSVGAGALGVTVLILLYPHLTMARIVGSDIAHAVPLTLLAGLGHWWLGAIDLPLLSVLLVGSLPGIVVGSYYAPRLPETVLRYVIAMTLILVGTLLLF